MSRRARRWILGGIMVAAAANLLLLAIPALRRDRLLVLGMLVASMILVLLVHLVARMVDRS